MDREEAAKKALETIKGVYEDKCAEINGRDYRFTDMRHKERRKVFAFYSKIQGRLEANDFSFLDTPEYEAVENVMFGRILFNDSALNKMETHWDKYEEDYLKLVTTAMGVISYPFLKGVQ